MRFLVVLASVLSMAVPAQAAPCLSVPDIQAVVDAAPDGNPTDLKAKLRRGGHGYTQVSFAGQCIDGTGTVEVDGRNGLWIERASAPALSWQVSDSTFIIFTGADAESITINGGSARVEVFNGQQLTASGMDLFYGGKVYVDSADFIGPMNGFIRNSTVGTLTLTGDLTGFQWNRGVTWGVLVNNSTGRSR